jgi:hypothetical protein
MDYRSSFIFATDLGAREFEAPQVVHGHQLGTCEIG